MATIEMVRPRSRVPVICASATWPNRAASGLARHPRMRARTARVLTRVTGGGGASVGDDRLNDLVGGGGSTLAGGVTARVGAHAGGRIGVPHRMQNFHSGRSCWEQVAHSAIARTDYRDRVRAPQTVQVIGHRGASGYRPEHSRSAYELAIALGADAVEPDIVATRDGELVLRHENDISGTTDVARHPEFAARRTTKTVDGASITGWFTEDFTWDELSTLRVVERLPALRPHSASFDGLQPMLRLRDLLTILDDATRAVDLVAEIKHPSYFA